MTPRINRSAKFAAGLVLAPVLAVSLLLSLGMTFVLVKDVVAAQGDWAVFEAQMRHYSERLEFTDTGSFVYHRAAYPVASFLGTVIASWIVSLLLGYLLERLRRDVWASGSEVRPSTPAAHAGTTMTP